MRPRRGSAGGRVFGRSAASESGFGRAPGRPGATRAFLVAFVLIAFVGAGALAPGASAQGVGSPFNEAPVAAFTFSPSPAVAGQNVTFDASESFDPDGTIERYEWDFTGDGTFDASGVTATWAFDEPGTYPVTLLVVDNTGTAARVTRSVQIGTFGVGEIEARFTYSPERPRPGNLVTFDASDSVFDEAVKYEWDLTGDGVFDASGLIVSRRYANEGVYRVTLRITDSFGRMSQHTEVVQIGKGLVHVTIESEPSDLAVYIDGVERGRTPVTLELEPERHDLRVRHYWRGEWETELDLRWVQEMSLRVVLR